MTSADWLIPLLRCPDTGLGVAKRGDRLLRSDGADIPRPDGIPSFVRTDLLHGSDAQLHARYERLAPLYEISERVLGWILTGADVERGRREIVERAQLSQGVRLLEVSPGPGVFQPYLRRAIGAAAPLAAVDLSLNMLRECRRRYGALGVELIHADAQRLPFHDAAFDALFHFGGINLFNDPARALAEFVRVVRPGGTVVWGDEHMSPAFRHPLGRRVLPVINPGFKRAPPAAPAGLANVRVDVVFGGLGYLTVAARAQ